jgi:outer membrane protein TolC
VVPAAKECPIDLGGALAVAGVENPTIGLADEAVRARRAELLQAQALLLPTLDAGASVDVHRGTLESSRGIIRDLHRQSAYAGAGAFAVGGGTVGVPGVRLLADLADAAFEPAVARRFLASQELDAAATRHDVLLDVAVAYLTLVGADARVRALRRSEEDVGEVVRMTANFAREGQGRPADAGRARSEALLLHAQEERAEEEAAVAAAELARLLDADTAVRFRAACQELPLLQFVGPQEDLERLVQVALANRPELGARAAQAAALQTRLRKERVRPLLPLLSVGFSAGEFGGGGNQADTRFGDAGTRTDFDAFAVWSLENFGVGNCAVQNRLRAEVGEVTAERARVANTIREEVADAYALSAAAWDELEAARLRETAADKAFRYDLKRARNVEGRPIELLNSLNLLTAARQDAVRALVGYDVAQVRLFVALGNPPAAAPPARGCGP